MLGKQFYGVFGTSCVGLTRMVTPLKPEGGFAGRLAGHLLPGGSCSDMSETRNAISRYHLGAHWSEADARHLHRHSPGDANDAAERALAVHHKSIRSSDSEYSVMKTTLHTRLCAILICTGLVATPSPHAFCAPYNMQGIVFADPDITINPTHMNSNGIVVGWSIDTRGSAPSEAFEFKDGIIRGLGDMGGGQSAAFGNNDSGVIVGESTLVKGGGPVAFMYTRTGGFTRLTDTVSTAYAVNNPGEIVGDVFVLGSSDVHAFTYSGGVLTDIGTLPGDTSSVAYAINDHGDVVGRSWNDQVSHAFLYSNGAMQDLGNLGTADSQAFDIDRNGDICGYSRNKAGVQHAFIYSDGVMHDRGGGAAELSLNDSHQAVGHGNGNVPDAILWTEGVAVNLNTVATGFQGRLNNAEAINDSGFIACTASTFPNAFLLTPVLYVKYFVPNTEPKGSVGFVIKANGVGFSPNSQIVWQGDPLATTFVSSSEVTAIVPASDVATAGRFGIVVTDGDNVSNPKHFLVTAAP